MVGSHDGLEVAWEVGLNVLSLSRFQQRLRLAAASVAALEVEAGVGLVTEGAFVADEEVSVVGLEVTEGDSMTEEDLVVTEEGSATEEGSGVTGEGSEVTEEDLATGEDSATEEDSMTGEVVAEGSVAGLAVTVEASEEASGNNSRYSDPIISDSLRTEADEEAVSVTMEADSTIHRMDLAMGLHRMGKLGLVVREALQVSVDMVLLAVATEEAVIVAISSVKDLAAVSKKEIPNDQDISDMVCSHRLAWLRVSCWWWECKICFLSYFSPFAFVFSPA